MTTDVIIIGGGAAGLCCAVNIKQKNPDLSVRVFEKLPRVCKKLSVTGNGRCNITNKNITLERYHGKHKEFCKYALEKYNVGVVTKFFKTIGVPFVYEEDKAYPASLQAGSVVDCLRFAAEDLGVLIHADSKITNIQVLKNEYRIWSDKLSFNAKNVVIATGLLSGGEKYGCDGDMLSLLQKAGFKTVKTTPAIVQIKTVNDITKQLKGIKVDAVTTLYNDGKQIRQDFGEVLFCDYGLSGPPIMQISREVSRQNGNITVNLNLLPDKDFNTLCQEISDRVKIMPKRSLEEFFTGFLNKRLGQVILKSAGCKLSDKAESLNANTIKKIVSIINCMEFKVTGTTGFQNSQVTAGGLETTAFCDKTMECKDYKNLYAIGEILDIDGDCGGFNLQWAWSSAMACADSIIGENK